MGKIVEQILLINVCAYVWQGVEGIGSGIKKSNYLSLR